MYKRQKKGRPKRFFSDFRLHFEVIFGALFGHFGDVGATYFSEGVRDRFGTVFGSILEVFSTVFGRIFGIILEVFFMKNVVLPAWEHRATRGEKDNERNNSCWL